MAIYNIMTTRGLLKDIKVFDQDLKGQKKIIIGKFGRSFEQEIILNKDHIVYANQNSDIEVKE